MQYDTPECRYYSSNHSVFPVYSSTSSWILQLSTCLKFIGKVSQLILFFLLSYIPVVYAGDGGEEFSNNLFSDLAPLLTLFGEQVTKQFISQSMGWTDHILLSMAPIGIITIVVSAIRVGGAQWLKNIIGRAVESTGTAEAELMSSTSSDVCELWGGRSVVRVLGSPDLVELIYRVDGKGHFAADQNGGVYDLKSAVSEGLYRLKYQNGPDTPPVAKEAPNLLLNICGTGAGRLESTIYAIVGVIAQLAVLVWCILVVAVWKISKGGNEVKPYALPLTIAGTSLICFGVMLCSLVVEASTTEKVYERVHGGTAELTDSENTPMKRPQTNQNNSVGPVSARTVYLQRGGQMVNDQRFEAYAIDGRDHYPTTYPNDHLEIKTSRKNHRHFEWCTLSGTTITISGFAAQFVGFRAMPWSCAIAQLLAMAIMAVARATARRGLSHWLPARPISTGWEMEWLAKDLTNNLDWAVSTGDTDFRKLALSTTIKPGYLTQTAEDVLLLLQRLYVIIGWERPSRKLAVSTAHAMENIMNILYNSKKDIIIRESWSEISEMSFKIPVYCKPRSPISQFAIFQDLDVSTISIRIKREKNTTTGDWGQWTADVDRLEAILGLWMFSRHNLQTDWNIAQTAHSLSTKAGSVTNTENENSLRQAQAAAPLEGGFIPSRIQRQRQILDRVSQFEIAGKRASGAGRYLQILGRFDQQRVEDYKTWLEIRRSQVDKESGVTRCGIRVWDKFYVQLQSETSGSKFVCQRHDCFGFEFGRFDTGLPRPVVQPIKPEGMSYRKGFRQLFVPPPVRGMTNEKFIARDKSTDVLISTTDTSGDDILGLDLVAKFMWSATDCIEAVHGVTHRRIINLEYDDTALINSVLEELAQSVVGAGLGDLQDAYIALIPPLSAAGKLPIVPEVIKQERAEKAIEKILA